MGQTTNSRISMLQQDNRSVRFSRHANQRLGQRGLHLSDPMLGQLAAAVDTLAGKGSQSALVMCDQLIMLVSVSKRTVITVMGRETLGKNIFTDIDSVIFIAA